jgi:hypothetical protein
MNGDAVLPAVIAPVLDHLAAVFPGYVQKNHTQTDRE